MRGLLKSVYQMSYQLSFIMKCSNPFTVQRPEKKDLPLSYYYAQAVLKTYTTVKEIKCSIQTILIVKESHINRAVS